MDKRDALDALKNQIVQDDVWPDLKSQATQLVMGNGSADADIVFIGEAPGKKEDESGEPFQGAAGKLLDTLLDTVNMTRDDVYVTNVVKYRPPNNRDPSPAEKAEGWPYLEQELAIIHPKVIMTLGRHSMSHFLPDASIGDVHGTVHDVEVNGVQYTIAPLYHPAATIYNRQLRQDFFDDLPRVLEQIK